MTPAPIASLISVTCPHCKEPLKRAGEKRRPRGAAANRPNMNSTGPVGGGLTFCYGAVEGLLAFTLKPGSGNCKCHCSQHQAQRQAQHQAYQEHKSHVVTRNMGNYPIVNLTHSSRPYNTSGTVWDLGEKFPVFATPLGRHQPCLFEDRHGCSQTLATGPRPQVSREPGSRSICLQPCAWANDVGPLEGALQGHWKMTSPLSPLFILP